jgi:hypothetical protein
MLSADDNKPMGKPGQRRGKKKAKAGAQQGVRTEPLRDAAAQAEEAAAQAEEAAAQTEEIAAPTEEIAMEISAPVAETQGAAAEASAVEVIASPPVVSVAVVPVSVQAIANAYGDYTRRSLEQAWTFLGKLASARSPAEAFELQMAFAKEACETFIAESQKISDLHGELAKQRVLNFEGFVAKVTHTTFVLHATRH